MCVCVSDERERERNLKAIRSSYQRKKRKNCRAWHTVRSTMKNERNKESENRSMKEERARDKSKERRAEDRETDEKYTARLSAESIVFN